MANPRAFISFDFDNNEGQKSILLDNQLTQKHLLT